ncbi:glycosyltransferase family 2 protein [Nodosilinea sp. PGN35]|uniref:glycosyltransferase family 2 protein n=1 Tax=Nodosilinea sp. PGN35 TaxID=3020489 RepID=UPI0023B345AB|nr:glycosyltransferase family 2 protein [Nodosilinea sp. TSF1-S3]MDF0367312.1 glycosyltransferase family 2 protein [Nodosilinea sp. TSF1-S3]
MEASIAIFIFNRPQESRKVFEAVRLIKPSRLFLVADGPRPLRTGETEKCELTRKIFEEIDWTCDVRKNYSEINLGCARRVSSGLNWVFSLVEEAIILEDDCVPHPTFFRYCIELLERYRDDERVMSICGLSVPPSSRRDSFSYCFSQYQRCWGWASWRRAWQHYDHDMQLWPQAAETNLLEDLLPDRQSVDFWHNKFQAVYDGKIDSWAYRWMLACWLHRGLSIIPSTNLIANVGVTSDATHTVNDSFAAQLTASEISFPLQHPPYMVQDRQADLYIQRTRHSAGLAYRVERKLKKLLKV